MKPAGILLIVMLVHKLCKLFFESKVQDCKPRNSEEERCVTALKTVA